MKPYLDFVQTGLIDVFGKLACLPQDVLDMTAKPILYSFSCGVLCGFRDGHVLEINLMANEVLEKYAKEMAIIATDVSAYGLRIGSFIRQSASQPYTDIEEVLQFVSSRLGVPKDYVSEFLAKSPYIDYQREHQREAAGINVM